jgi:TRAP-type mannitol/chloroaromatic compound transport system permease small subunit
MFVFCVIYVQWKFLQLTFHVGEVSGRVVEGALKRVLKIQVTDF